MRLRHAIRGVLYAVVPMEAPSTSVTVDSDVPVGNANLGQPVQQTGIATA
jgi:hypothetical protein